MTVILSAFISDCVKSIFSKSQYTNYPKKKKILLHQLNTENSYVILIDIKILI